MNTNLGARAIVMAMGQTATRAINFIWMIIFSRSLGPADFGVYTTLMSFMGIILPVSNFGVSLVVIRSAVNSPEHFKELFGALFWIRLLLSFICCIVIAIVWPLFGYPETWVPLFLLTGLYVAITTVHQVAEAIYVARERLNYFWGMQLAATCVWVAAASLALFVSGSLKSVFIALACSGAFVAIIHAFILRSKFSLPNLRLSGTQLWKTLRLGAPMGIIMIMTAATERFDRLFLSWNLSSEIVGQYGLAALLVYTIFEVLWYPFTTVLYPVLARKHGSDLSWISRKMFVWSIVLSCYLAASFYLMAPSIIQTVWGTRYDLSASFLKGLCWLAPFFGWNKLVSNALIACHQDKDYFRINGILLGLSILLNPACIILWGGWGAVVASVSIQFLGSVLLTRALMPLINEQLPFRKLGLTTLFAITCFSPVAILPLKTILFPLASIMFFTCIMAFVFEEEDRQILNRWRNAMFGWSS